MLFHVMKSPKGLIIILPRGLTTYVTIFANTPDLTNINHLVVSSSPLFSLLGFKYVT